MFKKPKPPVRKSAIIRALKFLVGTRPGAAMLGAAGGLAVGYPIVHEMRPRLASMTLPEGYYVEPRYRVYRRRQQ